MSLLTVPRLAASEREFEEGSVQYLVPAWDLEKKLSHAPLPRVPKVSNSLIFCFDCDFISYRTSEGNYIIDPITVIVCCVNV